MSPCGSRSLAPVLSLLVIAATSLAFEPAANAQAAAPKKGAPAATDPAATEPAAAEPAAPAAATAATPAKKDEEDKPHAVYISLDVAFTRADVGGISDATGFDKTGANGATAGLGVGYRYKGLRIGGRFRDTATTEYSLWSLMGEVGYGLPLRPIAPLLTAHFGYMFDVGVDRAVIASSLPRTNVLTPDVDLNGVVIGGELTANYWFTSFLRMGPFIGFDATILSRSKVDLPQSLFPLSDETRSKPLFNESGSGLGYMLSIGLRGTGDIAF